MARDLKFRLNDTTLTSDVNQTLSNLLSQNNKVKAQVKVVSGVATQALSRATNPALALEDLSDVLIQSAVIGQTIVWNGTEWVNGTSVPQVAFMNGPGFLAPPDPFNVAGVYPSGDTALDVITTHFNMTGQLTFNTISFGYVGGASSINFAVAIYSGLLSSSPGKLLWTSGPIAIPNATGTMEVTVPAFTLPPGDYYLATTTDASLGGLQILGYVMTTIIHGNGNIINHSIINVGKAANPATSGPTFPPTLGTIAGYSGSNDWGYPYTMFYKV